MNSLIKSATIIDKNSEFHNKSVDILIKNGIISDIAGNIKNSKTTLKLVFQTYMFQMVGLITVFVLVNQDTKKGIIYSIL